MVYHTWVQYKIAYSLFPNQWGMLIFKAIALYNDNLCFLFIAHGVWKGISSDNVIQVIRLKSLQVKKHLENMSLINITRLSKSSTVRMHYSYFIWCQSDPPAFIVYLQYCDGRNTSQPSSVSDGLYGFVDKMASHWCIFLSPDVCTQLEPFLWPFPVKVGVHASVHSIHQIIRLSIDWLQ